jgi:hypothetical protein
MNSYEFSSCCNHNVSSVCASNACLVVGCVLGVVRLEVCMIACPLPWSSGTSKRRKCSTLRKLITSVN